MLSTHFTFAADAPELPRLRGLLREYRRAPYRLRWTEFVDEHYTDEEILASPLVWMTFRGDQRGPGGPDYGTQFDFSDACSRCGAGAKPLAPFKLDAAEVPSRGDVFQTWDDEWFFSTEVAERLGDFSGVRTVPTEDAASGSTMPWVHVHATFELPPMDAAATNMGGPLRPCPECGRDGFGFNIKKEVLRIVYSRTDLDPELTPDFAHTFEHLGRSVLKEPFELSGFAQPLLIIKPSVVATLRELNMRELKFYPVTIS